MRYWITATILLTAFCFISQSKCFCPRFPIAQMVKDVSRKSNGIVSDTITFQCSFYEKGLFVKINKGSGTVLNK